MSRKVEYRGVSYRSVSELARALDFDQSLFSALYVKHKHLGSIDAMVLHHRSSLDRRGKGVDRDFEIKGVRYKRVLDYCDSLGWDDLSFLSFRFSAEHEHLSIQEVAELYRGEDRSEEDEVRILREHGCKFHKGYGRRRVRHSQWLPAGQIKWDLPVEIDGRVFSSLDEALRAYKITKQAFWTRINRGISLSEAFTGEQVPSPTRTSLTVKGVEYASQMEALGAFGFTRGFVERYQQEVPGLSFAEAIGVFDDFFNRYTDTRPKWISALPDVIYNGHWLSRAEFARACGVPIKLMHGKGPGVNVPLKQMEEIKGKKATKWNHARGQDVGDLLYPGCTYDPTGLCVNIGVDFGVYLQDVRAARGLAEPPKKKYKGGRAKPVTYKGVLYPSMNRFCEAHGLDYMKFYHFYQGVGVRDLSLEEVVEAFHNRDKQIGKPVPITYKGVLYPSVAALCRATGWSYREGLAYNNKQRGKRKGASR